MAIEVGDAVLKFLGDSTNLDTKFAEVGPNAEKAFTGAADSVEDGTGRMKTSMYEARGEARLLGEEFGIRLPRHVSNFLAELPGVGEALSAAFSATAVLFLAKAVVDVTQKVTDFATATFIYSKAQKESEQAAAETNKVLLSLADSYKTAKGEIDRFGAAGTDAIRLQRQALEAQITTVQASFDGGQKNIDQSKQQTHEYLTQTGVLSKVYDKIHSIVTGTNTQVESLKAATVAAQEKYTIDSATLKNLQEQKALLDKQLETEEKLEAIRQGGETQAAVVKLRAAQKDSEVREDSQTATKRKQIAEQLEDTLYSIKRDGLLKQLALLKENDANTKDAQLKLLADLRNAALGQQQVLAERLTKAKDELLKNLDDIQKTVQNTVPDIQIITPSVVQNILNGVSAAHNLGITLRQDLVKAYEDAKKAEIDFANSGIKDAVARKAVADQVNTARKALESYGQAEDRFKARSHGLWNEFREDTKAGATAIDQVKQLGVDAFDDLSRGMEQALATAILAQDSFGKAIEKATASALASLASQAIVKALFYTGEGFAALAGFNAGSASEFFQAAGLMAAVGAAAGLAAHALNGAGGSSSSNNEQQHNSVSNTGQSNRSGGSAIGVQAFATGGLISAPTLAIMGEESKREAVLPLDDPRAMDMIGRAIGKSGGGDVHVHVAGHVIGAADVAHLCGQINKRVLKGQAVLHASNSLRLTKRSA